MPTTKDSVDLGLGARRHTEDEMRRFVRETSTHKGYRALSIKNQKASQSLGHDERRLATQSRLVAQRHTKEQREMEEQLEALRLEKERIALSRRREQQESRLSMRTPGPGGDADDVTEEGGVVNPYPVSLRASSRACSRAGSTEDLGAAYLRSRGGRRRQSREFEDLDLNTSTGTLLPGLRLTGSRGGQLTGSRGQLTSLGMRTPSYQSLLRAADRDWAGHPENIGSVRRGRKTVEQQQRDAMLNRVSSAEKLLTSSPRPVTSCGRPVTSSGRPASARVTSGRVTSSRPGPVKATPLTSSSDVTSSKTPTMTSVKKPTKGGGRKRTSSKE